MGRKPKYRKAKRVSPFKLLNRQSKKLYGIGYLKHLENMDVITRDSFYATVKARTMANEMAIGISHRFDVTINEWYAGCKYDQYLPEQSKKGISHSESSEDFNELDELF